MAIKAYVLVVTDPGATKKVFEALKLIKGAVEIHEVMGPYDIIVEVETESLSEVPAILGSQIRSIPGIQSTTSLVTFPE
jgi:DNA-binding Lrp family transcriptional regulator